MPSIFDTLRDAAHAYYETDTPIMTDAEYDALLETARDQDPDNPFFNQVGAAPSVGRVPLPVPMPSLRKLKPDTFRSWSPSGATGFVLSDKLDGISALWVCGYSQTPALLLRGDGLVGQDCSALAKHIRGLKTASVPHCIVRGELILPRASVQEGTTARNWVNGILHRQDATPADLGRIEFLAYEVCQPSTLTRRQQFTWLENQGFLVPWCAYRQSLVLDDLQSLFRTRRTDSAYECDGLVIGVDAVPHKRTTAALPADCVAFKLPLDEQRATTVVTDVEWASSRNRIWVPRICFQPVQIGTATITCCTGVHAANIEASRVGPGARVVIRRSGDVIPVLDSVLEGVEPKMPPSDQWAWDANHVQAVDTRTEISADTKAVWLTHSLTTFGYEGIRTTSAKKLVEGGITSLLEILQAPSQTLQACLGPKTGQTLKQTLPSLLCGATEAQWIRAFPCWPKGFGEARIQTLLNACPSVEAWPHMAVPKGMGAAVLAEIQGRVPDFLAWRGPLWALLGLPLVAAAPAAPVLGVAPVVGVAKGTFAMSGFRDKALQETLTKAGWVYHDTIKKTTTILLVPDDAKETTKVAAARTAGIRIVPRSQVADIL